MTARRRQRGGRAAGFGQPAYGQRRRPYAPVRVLGDDQVAAIHEAGLEILSRIGIRVLDDRARAVSRRRRQGFGRYRAP